MFVAAVRLTTGAATALNGYNTEIVRIVVTIRSKHRFFEAIRVFI